MKRLLTFTLALALTGAGAFAQQRNSPPLPEGIIVKRDVAYVPGAGERQMLDVYFPEKAERPVPLIVWIHGGAWRAGSKANPPMLPMLREGFAVASVTYRFSQDAIFPAQIEDCRTAIRWLRAHSKELNIDPTRVAVAGSSAGGHLVALLGVTGDKKEWDKGENLDQSATVQAVVDLFGPANLLTMGAQSGPESRIQHDDAKSPESVLVGGAVQEKKEASQAASPVNYTTKDDAPFLIIHGDKDPLVPHAQSEELLAALKKAGVEASLRTIPGGGHGGPGFQAPEVRAEMLAFLKKHLKPL